MIVDRPPVLEALLVLSVAHCGQVVGQRVEPDVRDVLGVPRDRDAPVERGARDREVPQTALDETEHLVAAEVGHNRTGVCRVPVQEALFEGRQAEEVVLLLEVLDRPFVDRAVRAVRQVVLDVVLLTADAIEPRVLAEVDVAGVVAGLQQGLDGPVVPVLGRPDEVVVRDIEALPRGLEERRNAVGELLRGLAGGVRCLLDLQPVLVGAGEEVHVVAEQSVPTRERVPHDRRVGMPEVGLCVHVIDGSSDVEPTHAGEGRASRGFRDRQIADRYPRVAKVFG